MNNAFRSEESQRPRRLHIRGITEYKVDKALHLTAKKEQIVSTKKYKSIRRFVEKDELHSVSDRSSPRAAETNRDSRNFLAYLALESRFVG